MNVDALSDMFARIKNAYASQKAEVVLPFSQTRRAVAEVLKRHEFIKGVAKKDETLIIVLAYHGKTPAILGIKRVSKPGLRVYQPYRKVRRVLGGLGIYIVSTSQGIFSDIEVRKQKVGGEVIASVW